MLKQICLWTGAIMGIGAIANGSYMLAAPLDWYFAVPGVTDTGPFNQHFIRDIGLVVLFVGAAFLVGAFQGKSRVVLWSAASLWLGGHALFHFWEVAVGICGPEVIARDFPAVTLPAIIGGLLSLWAIRDQIGPRPTDRARPRSVQLFTL